MVIASDQPKAWSYSALTQYETCPKQFWHYRIKRDYKDAGNDTSKYGEMVHKSFKEYIFDNRPLPLSIKHMAEFVDPYKHGKFQQKYGELQLAINAEFRPTGWFDKDVYCRAIVDFLGTTDDVALVVDWKTGKMKPDEEATQLSLTGVMVMLHDPDINTVVLRYVWTQHKGKHTQFIVKRSQIPAIWNRLAPRLKRYQEAHKRDDFPANPSGLCRKYCPITSCPHNGQA